MRPSLTVLPNVGTAWIFFHFNAGCPGIGNAWIRKCRDTDGVLLRKQKDIISVSPCSHWAGVRHRRPSCLWGDSRDKHSREDRNGIRVGASWIDAGIVVLPNSRHGYWRAQPSHHGARESILRNYRFNGARVLLGGETFPMSIAAKGRRFTRILGHAKSFQHGRRTYPSPTTRIGGLSTPILGDASAIKQRSGIDSVHITRGVGAF